MSSDKEDKPKKKKKGGMLMKLLIPVVLIAISGGGVYGLVVAGVIGGGHGKEEKEDNNPKLVRKGEEDPYAPKKEGEKEGEGGAEVEGEGGSQYKTSYFTFSEEFTSNLKNSDALVQVSVACSTRRDGRVLMWLKKHELAIRSAMLNVLADTPEEDIGSLAGKEKLQKRLTQAINQVLTKEEGFGGVDQVYFKSFLVQ
ncbi:flagellar basal body-associated protein FliL [Novosphingobium sp.]|uniref:flagellar basal body-associated FliL family protein n=1 Tax=Novosphingobium sp. TaxID=1874826 RepID=UPI002634D330|nr:flagellar basal body-associated FliL family protein [Novosphingobium sp.]